MSQILEHFEMDGKNPRSNRRDEIEYWVALTLREYL